MTLWEMALKLVVAMILGGLIGFERETHGRPAGLRTHILVCVGATLFALCSFSVAGTRFDPGRVTAQIVTGIGFLGAGTIMRQGSVVRGLTTAASIWIVAAIGIAVAIGGDMMILGAFASALVFGTLNLVPHVERSLLMKQNERILTLTTSGGHEAISHVLSILAKHGLHVRVLSSEETTDGRTQILKVRVRIGPDFNENELAAEFAASRNVISYNWE